MSEIFLISENGFFAMKSIKCLLLVSSFIGNEFPMELKLGSRPKRSSSFIAKVVDIRSVLFVFSISLRVVSISSKTPGKLSSSMRNWSASFVMRRADVILLRFPRMNR